MPRPRRNQLHVWMNGEAVGIWQTTSGGGHVFHYEESWLHSPHCRPLSLSLPLRPAGDPWRGEPVRRFFDSLLPGTPRQRHWLHWQFGSSSADSLDLLAEVGLDCQGALRFTRADHLPPNSAHPARRLEARELERLLISLRQGVAQIAERGLAPRTALSGNHDKTALRWQDGGWHLPGAGAPSTHILRLPIDRHEEAGFVLSGSLENAWLCQRVAAAFGVDMPRCELLHAGAARALVVARTDRCLDAATGHTLALPEEDMCQAFGLPATARYQVLGAPPLDRVAHLLLGSREAEADRLTLLRGALVMWLLCAFDGHARHLRIRLLAGGGYRLAPPPGALSAYPLIGQGPGKLSADSIRMALDLRSGERPPPWPDMAGRFRDHAARAFSLPAQSVQTLIEELCTGALQISANLRRQLPAGFPVAVSEPILQGVVRAARAMRETGRRSRC
jgi:serine/threonine-protein kinase HipA